MNADPKTLMILGVLLVVVLFGGSIWDSFDNWIQTAISGPEYCFRDITQSDISIAAQGIEVKYTKTQGDELCFRTKDSSIIERLNQQIQDRKLQERLAEIEASNIFWNQTFPKLFLFGLIAVVIIVILIVLSNRDSRGYRV